jgi:hypothetical protein
MMRRGEREAWTSFVEGSKPKRRSKYGAVRTGKYDSKSEAEEAAKLASLERAGIISELREQVPFVLVEGRDGVSSVTYVADFVWKEGGKTVVADKKGHRTEVYKLKKRLMYLVLGISIMEL